MKKLYENIKLFPEMKIFPKKEDIKPIVSSYTITGFLVRSYILVLFALLGRLLLSCGCIWKIVIIIKWTFLCSYYYRKYRICASFSFCWIYIVSNFEKYFRFSNFLFRNFFYYFESRFPRKCQFMYGKPCVYFIITNFL